MKKRRKIIPPADIILDLINDEPDVDTKIIEFYDAYILEIAKEPKYTPEGEFARYEVNDDLAQELRIAVFRSLPKLRKAFFKRFGDKKPMVVVVAEEKFE